MKFYALFFLYFAPIKTQDLSDLDKQLSDLKNAKAITFWKENEDRIKNELSKMDDSTREKVEDSIKFDDDDLLKTPRANITGNNRNSGSNNGRNISIQTSNAEEETMFMYLLMIFCLNFFNV